MKLKIHVLLLLCFYYFSVKAQNFTIRGTIEDQSNGEHLISAYAYDAKSQKGTTSNYYGFYSLTLPKGSVQLLYSYTGYKAVEIEFSLTKDTVIDIKLDPITLLEEVVVSSNKRNMARNNQMGLVEMSAIQTKQLPVFMGESDIMKTIQLLPGVKGGTEGTSGMYVRGGGPDQNLILLDGVPVYNANHLFGFFSVFNSDAIQNFSLYKGGFPARYGGRLSSVLDIKMKEGNNKKFGGEASIGLISSKVTLEGPIVNEKTSFIVSARRTYIDVIPYLIMKSSNSEFIGGYYFYDVNAKVNHKFSDRSRVYLSLYNGLDKFYAENNQSSVPSKAGSGWGNSVAALRWNYVINDKLFSNTTATFSNYNFFINAESGDPDSNEKSYSKVEYTSGIKDWSIKNDFEYIPSTRHYIRFGGSYTYHTFNPGVNTFSEKREENSITRDTTFGNFKVYTHEASFYLEDDIEITEKLKVNPGLHFSMFQVRNKTYTSLQPRISFRYLITDQLSAKASAVQMKQYVHLLSSSNIGLPTDLWVPATDKVNPMEAWQYATGFAYDLNQKYEFSIEVYYKTMKNLVEYKEGASFFSFSDSWENKIESGKGVGKGIELLVNKTSGKVTGWIGYTLSYADRTFEKISYGKTFPYKYDRRHDISISMAYKKSEKFDMGIVWVYGTGNAATISEETYLSAASAILQSNNSWNNREIEYFESRNSYRTPSYHRLDLGFNFHKPKRWGLRTWSFGFYNAYNRQNPFFLAFDYKNNGTVKVLKQYSIFPVIPYFKYSIKF